MEIGAASVNCKSRKIIKKMPESWWVGAACPGEMYITRNFGNKRLRFKALAVNGIDRYHVLMKRPFKTKRKHNENASGSQCDRIFGIHAVSAALSNPQRKIRLLYATQNGLNRISEVVDTDNYSTVEVTSQDLSRRLGHDSVHQGVLIEADPLPAPELDVLATNLAPASPLLVLDQVTDPHNVGAILRSAATFNAAAVIMTRRNSPPLDGVLAKAASGAVEHVPIVLVTNLARALADLGQMGIQTIGLDGDANEALETTQLQMPSALVLGSEGKGLRRLTAENCDILCCLTTTGPLRSLNVSNATAVALHTLAMRAK